MNTKYLLPCLLGLCAVWLAACASVQKTPAAAASNKTVTVAFASPEKFTDLKSSSMDSEKDREYLTDELREHIVQRASSRMAEGQTLAITIKDVDMAGDFEPWHSPRVQDVRFIKDIYPPRIDLEFKLTDAGGKVVAEGPRQLRDLSFMMNPSLTTQNDTLRYEKRLIDDWISREFSSLNKAK